MSLSDEVHLSTGMLGRYALNCGKTGQAQKAALSSSL